MGGSVGVGVYVLVGVGVSVVVGVGVPVLGGVGVGVDIVNASCWQASGFGCSPAAG